MTCWQVVQDFRQSHKSILITASSNNIKLGARGFKCRPLKVAQDFFHQQYWNSMCLGEELQRNQRAEADGCFGHMHFSCQISTFELKVIKQGACRCDYIATQAGQSSAGMPENGCRTRRKEEAESFSKKHVKVTSDGQKCEGPKIQEILFFLRWVEEILHHLYNLRFANA